jgi:hypothetical protein
MQDRLYLMVLRGVRAESASPIFAACDDALIREWFDLLSERLFPKRRPENGQPRNLETAAITTQGEGQDGHF